MLDICLLNKENTNEKKEKLEIAKIYIGENLNIFCGD